MLTTEFNYDEFLEDVSHVKSIHDDVGSLRFKAADDDDFDSWWLLQVGRICVNTQRVSNLFWPVATHFAKQKSVPDRVLFDYQCLTLPSVVYATLHNQYLEVLHRHVEARICIDITTIQLTKEQKDMARSLYCCGYMLAMGLCVNMHDTKFVPSMQDQTLLKNKANADNLFNNIIKPTLVDCGINSFMSPYTYDDILENEK